MATGLPDWSSYDGGIGTEIPKPFITRLGEGSGTMATRWFYKVHEKVLGPLSSDELLRKVRHEEIKPTTEVRKDNSAWFTADQVNGLFETAFKDHPGKRVEKTMDTEYHGD